jgi:hypothetical protein
VHVGLDDGLLKKYISDLETWRTRECYPLADAGKSCLKKATPMSPVNAVMRATRSEYYQEVCGEYIDEDKRWILENKNLMGILFAASLIFPPLAVFVAAPAAVIGGFAVAGVENSVGAGTRSGIDNTYLVNGINRSFTSIYGDETARHVTDREYRCVFQSNDQLIQLIKMT